MILRKLVWHILRHEQRVAERDFRSPYWQDFANTLFVCAINGMLCSFLINDYACDMAQVGHPCILQ